MRSALGYVELAERDCGAAAPAGGFRLRLGRRARGAAQRARRRRASSNLETAVTLAEDAWPGKGIHYRMHPRNVACLAAAGIDCCVLANNHVLDWGYAGLAETLDDSAAARACAPRARAATRRTRPRPRSSSGPRAGGSSSSPTPCRARRAARLGARGPRRPGVNLLADLSRQSCDAIARQVAAARRPGDLVVVSIHWGGNWGYEISPRGARLRASADRRRRRGRPARPLLAPSARHRALPRTCDPLRLRRLSQRLRGHRRPRGRTGRSCA